MILSPPQESAFKHLNTLARYTLYSSRLIEGKLPTKLRSNTLLSGPSGSGKSQIINTLSAELKVPVLRLNVSSWIPYNASSGSPYTWDKVKEFVELNDRGIIFLDELDKLGGKAAWVSYIRLEIHELLDKKFPAFFESDENRDEHCVFDVEYESQEPSNESSREAFIDKFSDNFLIIGAGAWQFAWLGGAKNKMGFSPSEAEDTAKANLSEHEIHEMLSPELRRRFRSDVVTLDPLKKEDYLKLIDEITEKLSEPYATLFIEEATNRIPRALERQLEFRMLEEAFYIVLRKLWTNDNKNTLKSEEVLSTPQKAAYQSLHSMMSYRFQEYREDQRHPISGRTNLLLCGSSGAGKSHLVEMVTRSLEVPIFRANVSNWTVSGTKSEHPTLAKAVQFVIDNPRGVIFLDEIDKISHADSEWINLIRLEIHDLLDSIIPPCVEIEDVEENEKTKAKYPGLFKASVPGSSEPTQWFSSNKVRTYLERKLKNHYLIVGAGAWQHLWDHSSDQRILGFDPLKQKSERKTPDPLEFMSMISPEIQRRFCSEPIFIPRMAEEDYHELITEMGELVPEGIKDEFTHVAMSKVEEAIEHSFEFRMVEDALQEVCLDHFITSGEEVEIPSEMPSTEQAQREKLEQEEEEDSFW